MNDINRHEFPRHGWTFLQPQTGWKNPHAMVGFDASVKAIIQHRKANPAITAKHKLSTDYGQVADELEAYTRKRLGIPAKGSSPFPSAPFPLLAQNVRVAVDGVKRVASGAHLLLEWEQSGQPPVSPEISTARAAVCLECPKNTPGDFLKWFTKPVSEMLRAKLSRVHAMNLTTPHDAKLGVCEACMCPLKLKVHSPIDLIQKYMKPEVKADLWEKCWITNPVEK